MYAIVSTGGKQYKVAKDDIIAVEKLPEAVGERVEFDVLFVSDGDTFVADADALAKMKATAEIVEHFKGEKQVVFKFKKRKGYKKLNGHRQNLTRVRIADIAGAPKAVAKPAAKPAAVAVEKAPAKPVAKKAPTPAKTTSKASETKAAAEKPAAKAPAKKAPAKKAAPAKGEAEDK